MTRHFPLGNLEQGFLAMKTRENDMRFHSKRKHFCLTRKVVPSLLLVCYKICRYCNVKVKLQVVHIKMSHFCYICRRFNSLYFLKLMSTMFTLIRYHKKTWACLCFVIRHSSRPVIVSWLKNCVFNFHHHHFNYHILECIWNVRKFNNLTLR